MLRGDIVLHCSGSSLLGEMLESNDDDDGV